MDAILKKAGPAPTCPDDKREPPLVRVGGDAFCAALKYQQSLAAVPCVPGWHRLCMVDLSTRGIGFPHSEQLFPDERMQVVLLTGDRRTLEITRYQRLGPSCYRMGARFVRTEEAGRVA